jgi:hypothetical protein
MDRKSRALCELGDRAGHLDARWTAADHDEIEETTELARVRLDFGALERQQDPPTQIGGVVDRLQARRKMRPLLVAEIAVPSAGRHDETVEGDGRTIGM